jgi:hypothetical protein
MSVMPHRVRRTLPGAFGRTGLLLVLAGAFPPLLAAQAVLSGTVIEAGTGEPAPGVEVQLESWDGVRVAVTRTDPEGAFRMSVAREGGFIVSAASAAYVRSELTRVDLVDGEETRVTLEVTRSTVTPPEIRPLLPPVDAAPGEIAGRVYDAGTGTAVPSARVLLASRQGDTIAVVTSGSGGEFRLAVPRDGTYHISAELGPFARSRTLIVEGLSRTGLTVNVALQSDPVQLEEIVASGQQEIFWWVEEKSQRVWTYYERRHFYGRLNMGRFYDGGALRQWGDGGVLDFIRAHAPLRMNCRPGLVVDGWNAGSIDLWGGGGGEGWGVDAIALLDVDDIEGIEIYDARSGLTPPEFGGCMTIAVWRRPRG